MKKTVRIQYVLLSILGVLVTGTAHAQVTLTFDENGSSSASSGTDPYSNLGVQTDNEPGATVNTLYTSPGSVNGSTLDFGGLYGGSGSSGSQYFSGGNGWRPEYGWVAIYAYGTPSADYGTQVGLLDLIHFDNSIEVPANTPPLYLSMYWYSLEGTGQLADNWLPSSTINTILAYTYTTDITEEANGLATYTPGGTNSGGYSFSGTSGKATQYTYDFQSSVAPVPEPSTVVAGVLLLLPLGISSIRVLYRKRAV